MKNRESLKNDAVQASLLLGLILSLGFSVSWNPSIVVTRNELAATEKMEFASIVVKTDTEIAAEEAAAKIAQPVASETGDDKLKDIDLSKLDPKMKLKVSYALDAPGTTSDRKVRFFVKSTEGVVPQACEACMKVHTEVLSDSSGIKSIEILERLIGQMAIDKLKAKPVVPVTTIADKPRIPERDKKDDKLTSECDEMDDAETRRARRQGLRTAGDVADLETRLDCKHSEFDELVSQCEEEMLDKEEIRDLKGEDKKIAIEKRKTCQKKISSYYSKFLRKDLRDGLAVPGTSRTTTAIMNMRNGILRTLPDSQTRIRTDILDISEAGILNRARAYAQEQQTSFGGRLSNYEVNTRIKNMISNELSSIHGAGLCASYTRLSQGVCSRSLQDTRFREQLIGENRNFSDFNSSFLNPLDKVAKGNPNAPINIDQLIAQSGGQGEFGGDVESLDPLSPNFLTSRGQGSGVRATNAPYLQASPTGGNLSNNRSVPRILLPNGQNRYQGSDPWSNIGSTPMQPNYPISPLEQRAATRF